MNDPPVRSPLRSLLESTYARLALAVLIILAGYTLLLVYFVNSYTARLYEVHSAELRRIVDLGLAALEPIRANPETYGSMEQARREGAITLRELTYRYRLGENYLFMGTTAGVTLVHPWDRSLEMSNGWDLTDSHGTYYVREMVAIAQSETGAGYLEYYYPPPGGAVEQRKVSYIVAIPEWDAYIGAGMYMGEADAQNRAYVMTSLGLTLGGFVLIALVASLALRPIVISYRLLLGLFEQVKGDPSGVSAVPVDRFRRGSEAWQLMVGFERMLRQIESSEQARREAALAERGRLARELHDAVTQTLFSASIIADVLPTIWEKDQIAARARLQELRQLTRGALAEMRSLLIELRPAALVTADLGDLLRQLAEAVIGRARLPVVVRADHPLSDLPPDVKIALYRITQEALNNIVKHAAASQAAIDLRAEGGRLVLRVSDDGCGFDASSPQEGAHFGLATMQERAASIGAAFDVDSIPGQGTTIIVTWQPAPHAG